MKHPVRKNCHDRKGKGHLLAQERQKEEDREQQRLETTRPPRVVLQVTIERSEIEECTAGIRDGGNPRDRLGVYRMQRKDQRAGEAHVAAPCQSKGDEGDPQGTKAMEKNVDGVEALRLEAREVVAKRMQDHVQGTIIVADFAQVYELPDTAGEERTEVRPV